MQGIGTNRAVRFLLYIFLGVFLVIQAFPLLWTLLFSLKSSSEIVTSGALALPERFLFENYVIAWQRARVSTYFFNSMYVTSVTVIATMALALPAAYAIARMRWKLARPVMFFFLAGLMVPIHVTLIPLFVMLNNLGLLGSYLGLLLPYITVGLPLGTFISVNFLRSMPKELEEAAVIDGCNLPGVFLRIVVPVSAPALSTIAIFTFLQTWNEFIMANTFIRDQDMRTLPVGIRAFLGEYLIEWGPLGAAIIISSVPLFLMYAFFSEQVERSMLAGSVLK